MLQQQSIDAFKQKTTKNSEEEFKSQYEIISDQYEEDDTEL